MKMFRCIIAGSRTFRDYDKLKMEASYYLSLRRSIEIVSGGQVTIIKDKYGNIIDKYGADYLGELYAKEMGYELIVFRPDWKEHGRAAGPIRNEEMALYSDACICFWDGRSSGTKNMIDLAKRHGLKLAVIKF